MVYSMVHGFNFTGYLVLKVWACGARLLSYTSRCTCNKGVLVSMELEIAYRRTIFGKHDVNNMMVIQDVIVDIRWYLRYLEG